LVQIRKEQVIVCQFLKKGGCYVTGKEQWQLSRLLNEFFGRDMDHISDGPCTHWLATRKGTIMPDINIREENANFCIEVAAPGMKKDEFKVTIDNCLLAISAEQPKQYEEKNQYIRYTRRESSNQSFSCSFQLAARYLRAGEVKSLLQKWYYVPDCSKKGGKQTEITHIDRNILNQV
jgi:HSP20 family protein